MATIVSPKVPNNNYYHIYAIYMIVIISRDAVLGSSV